MQGSRSTRVETAAGSAGMVRGCSPAGRLLVWRLACLGGFLLVAMSVLPQLSHWPSDYSVPVRAQVTEAHFDQGAGWLPPLAARAVFSYRYVHDGRVFAGSAYRASGGRAEAVRRFLPGAVITVHVDPSRPGRALVQPGLSRHDAGRILLGLLLLAFAAIRLILISRENTPCRR
ncbi:DUF3592 domain-containing protein [Wenzhouxiangella sediminis]|uniref:DUF3592 domain-containing protein n=1 Tax=Wenzhouxiangella sediminis TaxID=1792836 RepID=A0A3E1K5J1_9GAMM|nr:DUF3592 domain-containing protein [Wenzhouxiangella sediminis]RFF29196.1 DUF3592 domain-containing protein [Wenzhouxiangella sediminis]